MRILIVEDDVEAAEAMQRGLSEAGHETSHAADGEAGLKSAQGGDFDVLIVDRMMPKMNGVQVVETLRREGDNTPVLFLSALGEVGDRVTGLQAGGDDYLVKPYAFAELIARVEALARRRETGSVATLLRVGDLEMDLVTRKVTRGDQHLELTAKEFDLLEYFLRHQGHIVSREMLARDLWQIKDRSIPLDNVIDVHIARLRRKVDGPFVRKLVKTVRGVGYRLTA